MEGTHTNVGNSPCVKQMKQYCFENAYEKTWSWNFMNETFRTLLNPIEDIFRTA